MHLLTLTNFILRSRGVEAGPLFDLTDCDEHYVRQEGCPIGP